MHISYIQELRTVRSWIFQAIPYMSFIFLARVPKMNGSSVWQICFSKRLDGHTNLCGQVSNIFPSLSKTLQFAMALRCLDLAGKVLWGPQTVDTKMSCKDFRELVATALGVPLNRVSLVPLLILTDHGILDGGFNHFLFLPLYWEDSQFD